MKSYPRTGASRQENVRIPPRRARGPRRGAASPDGGALPVTVDATKRRQLVAEAAYYRAEKRGFAPGGEMADWLEAEAEVRQLLGS